jgi:hypothetical protein
VIHWPFRLDGPVRQPIGVEESFPLEGSLDEPVRLEALEQPADGLSREADDLGEIGLGIGQLEAVSARGFGCAAPRSPAGADAT